MPRQPSDQSTLIGKFAELRVILWVVLATKVVHAFGQTARAIMAGKIPAGDFAAVVDAVEQRRAMEEYGGEDWVIYAIN
jgi:hypothetical protein